MNKTNLTNWLAGLCAVLLVVLLVRQSKQMTQLDSLRQQHEIFASATTQRQQETHDAVAKLADQLTSFGTNLESRLAQSDQQAKEKLGETMIAVQQQTAVIHRALGKVIPVELPDSLTKKLAALEARISDEKSWPKDLVEADVMLAELRDLVRQIPPWAEEDLLPRLNAVRWNVQSLQLLQTNVDADGEALEAATEFFSSQLSTQPDGGSTNIAVVLANRQKETAERFAAYRRDTAIKDAKEQLGLAVTTDGLAVWQRLSEWTNSPTHGQQLLELRQQLRSRLLDDEVSKFGEATRMNLQKLGVLTNVALRQAGYFRTLENVTVQRLRSLEEPNVPTAAANLLADLSASVESQIKGESERQKRDEARLVRSYQQWTLQRVSSFRRDFTTAQQQKKPGLIYGANAYTDFGMIRDAMVKNLLPISPGHLDSAVAKIYGQAFEEGWNKLGGKDEKYLQTEVAQKDATTPKKTPQNYLEDEP